MDYDRRPERYINPYTDFGFKKLFGTDMNKELLISFLNALFDGKEEVKDITYLNTEHIGSLELDRKAVFDVYCENEKGEKFLVEMQKGEQEFFKDRSIYYVTFPIREQAKRGDWNYELKAVYAVSILNFVFDQRDDKYYHHEIKLMDTGTNTVFYDKLTLFYLEMPKFNKTEDELHSMFDKWLFVLKNLSSLFERPAALQERVFKKLFEAAEIARFNPTELNQYEDSLKNFRDLYSVISTAEKKGHAEGFTEGRAEGRAEGFTEGANQKAVEIAREMLAAGMPVDMIANLTKLSKNQILEL
ncbi:MAG TPA: Rpn family recombination-promoting nuclease/putative transposase [Candidatus Avimuribaculum pullicola]|nr:Rpn family recombination-promoting nuclease/putative transposase [Candidatus Avimuribaculum pullicola]